MSSTISVVRDPSPPKVRHLPCDLNDEDSVLDCLRKVSPERIYHLAGASRISAETAMPEYFSQNFLTTTSLIRGLKALSLPCSFFFASTVHVYGNQSGLVTETSPPRPNTAHGFSKYLAEEALRASAMREAELQVVVGRFYNCIGPGQPEGFVAADLCRRLALLADEPAPRLKAGALTSYRRFLDVRDAVKLLPPLMKARHPTRFEVFNLASPHQLQIRELLNILVRESGMKVVIESDAAIAVNPFTGLELSLDKLESTINVPSFHPIEKTLKEMYEHARKAIRKAGGQS